MILENDNHLNQDEIIIQNPLTIQSPSPDGSCPNKSEQELGVVNKTVPDSQVEAMNKLFECDEHEQSDGGHYIDLTYNPERFTGNFIHSMLITLLLLFIVCNI